MNEARAGVSVPTHGVNEGRAGVSVPTHGVDEARAGVYHELAPSSTDAAPHVRLGNIRVCQGPPGVKAHLQPAEVDNSAP